MSKLLSRAKASLLMADYIYTRIGEDDVYLDACCFNLQQAIEFSLKFVVEMTGNPYAENHDIRANLNILARNNYKLPMEKKLREKANLLYSWETESRYKESFLAAIDDVKEVFTLARQLLLYAEALLTPAEVEPMKLEDI